MRGAFCRPAALARFFLTALVGIALDLWTKHVAFNTPSLATRPYPFIPGWLEFEMVKNQGAVFGLGQGQRILFVGVSIGAIIFLVYLFAVSGRRAIYQILLGMLLAGVAGNLYDRLVFGYVRDMIHVFPAWPNLFKWVFNVADSLLCVGVALMILYNMFSQRKKREPAP